MRHPPPAAGSPALRRLTPGRWWRVHDARFAPTAFNDSGQGDARFSPLHAGGRLVPTLYAAATLEAALMETVLHDVPYPSEGHLHDVDRDFDGPLVVSEIEIAKPLQLVDLTQLGLQRMGLKPSQMFETNADDHPRTRAWAAWLHGALPKAQGLVWMSARHAEHAAVVLFGDRVGAGVLKAATAPRPLRDAQVAEALFGLLLRLGCGVAPNR